MSHPMPESTMCSQSVGIGSVDFRVNDTKIGDYAGERHKQTGRLTFEATNELRTDTILFPN
jgi:hypothetical protein